MSQEHINGQLKKSQDDALLKDFNTSRCTILTEMHGKKWRVCGMGPRKQQGIVKLVTLVREYDNFLTMIQDLPKIADSFYSVQTTLAPEDPADKKIIQLPNQN